MAETATVGELLVLFRADVSGLVSGSQQAQNVITGMSTRSVPGLRLIENGFRALALQAAGIPGPVGRIAMGLLQFSTGGVVTLGVLAGLGAIALAWQKITKEARESAKAQADAVKEGLATPLRDAQLKLILSREAYDAAVKARDLIRARMEKIPEYAIQPSAAFPEGVRSYAFLDIQKDLGNANLEIQKARSATQAWEEKVGELSGAFVDLDAILNAIDLPKRLEIGKINPYVIGRSLREMMGVDTVKLKDVIVPWTATRTGDQFLEDFRKTIRQKYEAMRLVGQSIGDALAVGINDVLSGGNFLKGFFHSLLNIAISVGSRLAGAAIGNALFPGVGAAAGVLSGGGGGGFLGKVAAPAGMVDFSGFPAATNPLAAARDAQWQSFFRESGLVARKMGYR